MDANEIVAECDACYAGYHVYRRDSWGKKCWYMWLTADEVWSLPGVARDFASGYRFLNSKLSLNHPIFNKKQWKRT